MIKIKSIHIDLEMEKRRKTKKKKTSKIKGLFSKLFGAKKGKEDVKEESASEEEEPPKYIYTKDFCASEEAYQRTYTSKELKSIYKRLVDNEDPQFVDVIICTAVERIAKKRDNYACLGLRKLF
jgi:bisphosphoglycerate-dependent phosphoglycerate mutase